MTNGSTGVAKRPRLLVLNQYFGSVEASGQMLWELCSDLAEDFDITVIAGRGDLSKGPAASELLPESVTVLRPWSTHFPRSSLGVRALNYLTFLVAVLIALVRVPRVDVVLCLTDPPVIGLVGALYARATRRPLVVGFQDVFPEAAVASGRLENPLVIRGLAAVRRTLIVRATRIVVLGDAMRGRLVQRGADSGRVAVIPNWTDLDAISPPPRDSAWATEHGCLGPFTVMYSGNLGLLHSLETVVDVAQRLPEVRFIFVGDGSARRGIVARVTRLGLENVTFLPYQPRDRVIESLGAADIHLVSLLPGLAGVLEPTKIFNVMAVERPVLAAMEPESVGAELVRNAGCGRVVAPADPDAMVAALEELRALPRDDLERMGRDGRAYLVRTGGRRRSTRAYAELLLDIACAGAVADVS